MSTLALITQAIGDKQADANAGVALANATSAKAVTASAVVASALALCNDLVQNGPAVTVDTSASPPVVTQYTPALPDSYNATVIRVAT